MRSWLLFLLLSHWFGTNSWLMLDHSHLYTVFQNLADKLRGVIEGIKMMQIFRRTWGHKTHIWLKNRECFTLPQFGLTELTFKKLKYITMDIHAQFCCKYHKTKIAVEVSIIRARSLFCCKPFLNATICSYGISHCVNG